MTDHSEAKEHTKAKPENDAGFAVNEANLSETEKALLNQIERNTQEMMDGIFQIVSISSERSDPEEGAPYGTEVRKALDETLKLAEKMGFETAVVDDAAGFVQYGAPIEEDQDYIGVFGHLDVVPAEGDWSHDPYDPDIRDDRIYARGILDNKGPVLSCLYALKALKDLDIKPVHPIRIVFGTNEETGMEDMPIYLAKEKAPLAGFTPDCKYPVVYAERGRAVYEIHFDSMEDTISWVNAYFLANQSKEKALGLDIEDPEFGKLDIRNTRMETDRVTFSVSYPPCIEAEKITRILQEKTKSGSVICTSDWKPVFFNKEGTLCKTLQSAYEDLTELDGTPVPTTGGTYAKRVPGILPFGPSFPGQKGIAHLPDEWMNISDLKKNAEIYGLGLYRLGQQEEFE